MGPFTLKVDGVPFDLTDYTVTLVLRDGDGNLITPGGIVTKKDQVEFPGQITYQPIATDFVFRTGRFTVSTVYQMHWKVTDANTRSVFFPNDGAAQLEVFRA